jgi:hypothetical protein
VAPAPPTGGSDFPWWVVAVGDDQPLEVLAMAGVYEARWYSCSGSYAVLVHRNPGHRPDPVVDGQSQRLGDNVAEGGGEVAED